MQPILTKDFIEFIEILLKHKVEFLLCGGHAVAFHGHPRLTMDFDILIKPTEENANKLMSALAEFGFANTGIEKKIFTKEKTAVTLGAQPNQIDLLTSVSSQKTEEIFKNAVKGKLLYFDVLYISKEDLIRAKKEAGRKKDLADIEGLKNIQDMNKNSKIYVAGHTGMVGSAILRKLSARGYTNIVTRTHAELDLRNSQAVQEFFINEKPEFVFLAAAKVGGIKANSENQAQFLYDNLMIAANIIESARLSGVKKLCYLGSSCIYPRNCPQPIKEEYLLTGPFEPTNEGYAVAKLAGYKLAYYYAKQYGMNNISLMPCNLYGINDNFDLNTSHVFSALIKRFCDAVSEEKKEITLWGTGKARREFMNVDDFSSAAILLMQKWNEPEIINVGTGEDISIKELSAKIAKATGFKGKILWDHSIPDGMPRKCLDISKLRSLGFKPKISLDQGIKQMISEYKKINRSS